MADADSDRTQNLVTMGEIERAFGTQDIEFIYEDGLPTKLRFSGQTLPVREALQRIDAAREKAAGK